MTNRMWAARGSTERGIGFVSVLVILALVILIGGTALKAVPALLEYASIKRATNQIETEGIDSVDEIQKSFDRYAAIEDITAIAGKDLVVTRTPNGMRVSFQYEKRVHMVGPMYLLFDFEGNTARH